MGAKEVVNSESIARHLDKLPPRYIRVVRFCYAGMSAAEMARNGLIESSNGKKKLSAPAINWICKKAIERAERLDKKGA